MCYEAVGYICMYVSEIEKVQYCEYKKQSE